MAACTGVFVLGTNWGPGFSGKDFTKKHFYLYLYLEGNEPGWFVLHAPVKKADYAVHLLFGEQAIISTCFRGK